MYLLCNEFIKISRKFRHSPAFINNVPTLVRQLFTGEVQIVMTDMELETLFYVSGWSIHALSKASKSRSAKVAYVLCKMVEIVSIDPNSSEKSE